MQIQDGRPAYAMRDTDMQCYRNANPKWLTLYKNCFPYENFERVSTKIVRIKLKFNRMKRL